MSKDSIRKCQTDPPFVWTNRGVELINSMRPLEYTDRRVDNEPRFNRGVKFQRKRLHEFTFEKHTTHAHAHTPQVEPASFEPRNEFYGARRMELNPAFLCVVLESHAPAQEQSVAYIGSSCFHQPEMAIKLGIITACWFPS